MIRSHATAMQAHATTIDRLHFHSLGQMVAPYATKLGWGAPISRKTQGSILVLTYRSGAQAMAMPNGRVVLHPPMPTR
jgi:hypothetical protein